METEQAGPAEEAVAATGEQPEPKKEVYERIRFSNLRDPGINLGFTYNGLRYNLIDGEEVTLKQDIVKHLASRMVPDIRLVKNANGDTVKINTTRPRFMCQTLETFEK